jgi:viroplasmin and RNaseH domain-containing protein
VSIEEEIVTALEEMLGALEQLQKNNEEKKQQQQQQQSQQQQPGDQNIQPLVDALAELRLIKTLQMRVNTRTDRLAKQSESASEDMAIELANQLEQLSDRQEKIENVTREIALEAAAAGG